MKAPIRLKRSEMTGGLLPADYDPNTIKLRSEALLYMGPVQFGIQFWLFGFLMLGVIVLLLPWRQNISGAGRVTALKPEDRAQKVISTIPGRVDKWFVEEGQLVKAGDTLVQLSEIKDKYFDPKLKDRYNDQIAAKQNEIKAKEAKIESLNDQIEALSRGKNIKLVQVRYKIAVDSADVVNSELGIKIAQRQLEGIEALYKQGLKSLTEMEQRKLKMQEATLKLQSAQNKLYASTIELQGVVAEYKKDLAKSHADQSATLADVNESKLSLSKLESDAAAFGVRTGLYILRAPQAGYVVKALKQGIGEQVNEQDAVVTIMPENPGLAVELFISPNNVPLLHKGQNVRLQFAGWPALQFSGWPSASVGTFGGKVHVVDYAISDGGYYRILVVPDAQDESWPASHLLRQGSGVYGWALLKEVPVWFELWRQFNGFPPALPGVPVVDTPTVPKVKK